MKNIKDKKIIILGAILLIFTIGYFIIINHISYAFSNNYSVDESYKILINTIKECSIAYAKQNTDLFKNDKIAYIKVQDLIDKNLLMTNSEGNIVNPLNQNETLNSNIIKIKKENEEIVVTVDS